MLFYGNVLLKRNIGTLLRRLAEDVALSGNERRLIYVAERSAARAGISAGGRGVAWRHAIIAGSVCLHEWNFKIGGVQRRTINGWVCRIVYAPDLPVFACEGVIPGCKGTIAIDEFPHWCEYCPPTEPW